MYNALILGPPVLHGAANIPVKENNSITVNLCPSGHQLAFPQPHSVSLQKLEDNIPIDDSIILSDCGVKFLQVKKRHRGSYQLQVVNYYEGQVGKDAGNFSLNVECKH